MNKILLFAIAFIVVLPPSSGAQVSGKVEVLERGGSKRPVVQDVLVYIEGLSSDGAGSSGNGKVTISSHDKAFEPRFAAVTVGSSVSFPNLDDIMHNVFSISRGNRFDLGLYKSGAAKDVVFENPGLVRVYCNIHPQMSAFVYVMENSYYAWAEPDGGFHIEGVAPGSYRLKVWNEEGESEKPIVVTEQGARGVVVQLDVSEYKKRPHLNKFGKPYKRKRGKY
jgi:plastocyanin